MLWMAIYLPFGNDEKIAKRAKKSEHFLEMFTPIIITKSILPCILSKD